MTSISMTTKPLRPTLWIEQRQVFTWDQTRLPFEREVICLENSQDCARAIAGMQVRGAPLIGAVAALGMAMAIREALAKHPGCYREAGWLDTLAKALLATRPTAVIWPGRSPKSALRSTPSCKRQRLIKSLRRKSLRLIELPIQGLIDQAMR